MSKGKLLIISPAFHGYWRPLEAAFARNGWDVRTHCYDQHRTLSHRLQVKLRSELPSRLGLSDRGAVALRLSLAARAAVHSYQPERVLIVKGDVLTEPFWEALDRPRVPRSLWLYDELRRTQHTDMSLDRFDAIASYSHSDVASLRGSGRNATFVPLAFSRDALVRPGHLMDVTLVGARYPKREHYLRVLHEADVPVRAFGRDWSRHPFDRLRTWRLDAPPFATERDITLAEAYTVMASAPSTLNIHGDQDGFTMRTFEAAGVGAVQLVDRAEVSEFYEPGVEVLPFSSSAELVELAKRSIRDDGWGDRIRAAARRRTLAEHTFDHRAKALEASWA